MEWLPAHLYPLAGEAAARARFLLDATSLHAPGTVAAMAVFALCLAAGLVMLDAARRTAAVPTWTYLRREIAQLAAERDGRIGTVEQLRSEWDSLSSEVEALRAEKRSLEGVRKAREEQEAALGDIMERIERYDEDQTIIDLTRAELDELKAEKSALKDRVDALREEEAARAGETERFRARHARLDEDIEKAKAMRLGLRAGVAQLERERDLLLRHLDGMRVDLRQIEHDRKQASDELETIQQERNRLAGETHVIHGRLDQIERERQDIERKIVSAQGRRTKLIEGNGRLEAERSTLWLEFVTLQERRQGVLREITSGESAVRDLRLKRDALHGEIEMLKRVFTSLGDVDAIGMARA